MRKEITCKNCGNTLEADTEFCLFCGSVVTEEKQVEEIRSKRVETVIEPTVIVEPDEPETEGEKEENPKDEVVQEVISSLNNRVEEMEPVLEIIQESASDDTSVEEDVAQNSDKGAAKKSKKKPSKWSKSKEKKQTKKEEPTAEKPKWDVNYDGYYDYVEVQEEKALKEEQKGKFIKALGLIAGLIVVYIVIFALM